MTQVLFINSSAVICLNAESDNPSDAHVSFTENSFNFIESTITFEFTSVTTETTTVTVSPTPTAMSPTSTSTSTPTLSVSPTPTPTRSSDSKNTLIPNYAWAAICVGVLIICILLLGSLCIVYQNRRAKRNNSQEIISGNPRTLNREKTKSMHVDPNHIPISELKNLKQIEKGSFGVIYEAVWRGTKIAVKKLPTTMTDKQLNEFYQEADLMRSLRHPNILQYLGISRTGREICICMEYMPLGSLYRILHSAASFDRRRIKNICLDTVRGMNYLHQQQPPIIHRDLKSHNLLVDRHWQVKVCDFGLSRITAQNNQTMTACGTPSWTAPEVLRNERYTTKADVYGFGVVVWELFARADPFPGLFFIFFLQSLSFFNFFL